MATPTPDAAEPPRRNALEWSVFAVGVAATLLVLGALAYQAATASDAPPHLEVTLLPARRQGATVLVPLQVHNRGGRVAEDAVVEVCAGPEACGEVAFQYVPTGSVHEGVVGLAAPLTAPLTARVASYRTP